MGPDESASHPGSISPYGLYDTAGNSFEWTRGERPGSYVARGGSYYHDRKTADLANRNESSAIIHEPTAGLRICADATVTLPDHYPRSWTSRRYTEAQGLGGMPVRNRPMLQGLIASDYIACKQ